MGRYMLYVWLAVFAICLIVELIDAGTLVSCWFSVGAIIPFFMSFYKTNAIWYIILQILVFGVVSACCLIFLRKIVLKFLSKHDDSPTGVDRYVGKTYKICRINEGTKTAYVKINGVEYEVLTENELHIDDKVEFVKFDGNKIVIK